MNTEPYWRDAIRNEQDKGKTHFLIPLAAFESILDRLDFAKSELHRLENQVNRTNV